MNLTHLLDIRKTCNYSFIAQGDHHLYLSKANGIRPIMINVRENKTYFQDHIIVDRIIGKAAAMLLIRSKVAYIHGVVMSESADQLLMKYHIPHTYDHKVAMIENNDHTGMCPMEETVKDIDDFEEAFEALTCTIQRLMANKK